MPTFWYFFTKDIDPELHHVVSMFMIHGPCGSQRLTSPCMDKGKCCKYFPKKFVNTTTIIDPRWLPGLSTTIGALYKRERLFSTIDMLSQTIDICC